MSEVAPANRYMASEFKAHIFSAEGFSLPLIVTIGTA
jgi:hypothetical protein